MDIFVLLGKLDVFRMVVTTIMYVNHKAVWIKEGETSYQFMTIFRNKPVTSNRYRVNF